MADPLSAAVATTQVRQVKVNESEASAPFLSSTAVCDSQVCPYRTDLVRVDSVTGVISPVFCERLRACAVCLRRQAWRYARAIGLARPDQFITLTRIADTWQDIRGQINGFRTRMKKRLVAWQDIYYVERHHNGDPHVHLWQWGSRVTPYLAREMAVRAGLGPVVDVQPWLSKGPVAYGLKTILKSPSREGLTPGIDDFLNLNGNRLSHSTKQFWRDEHGNKLAGFKAADAHLRRLYPESIVVRL